MTELIKDSPVIPIPETFTKRKGDQTPTLHIYRENATSLYDTQAVIRKDIESWVSKPFPWQELVYRDIFAIKPDGSLQYKTVCLSVPRRNGKTEIILGTMLIFAILLGAKVLYTAQIQDTADDIYARFMDLVESKKSRLHMYFPGIQRKTKVSEEVVKAYDPNTGRPLGTLEFRGRRGDKGRGITRDVLIIDEAQDYDTGEEQRFGSINGSSELGMTFLVGTPPPLDTKTDAMASGTVFRQLRDEALAEEGAIWETRTKKGTAWIEWGADSVKEKSDRDAWYRYNPSMGYLPRNALSEEWFENRPSSTEVFSVENLGYWTKQSKDRAIEISTFNRLGVTGSELQEGLKGRKFALGVKSDMGDSVIHIGSAFRRLDGKIAYLHVQTVYMDEEGADRLLEALLIKMLKSENCVAMHLDGALAGARIIPMLTRHSLWYANRSKIRQGRVTIASFTEMAKACSMLTSAISSRNLVHSGQAPLHDAVEDAGKRKIGDSGYGFRSLSAQIDVTPLEACALAVYGVESRAQIKSSDIGGENLSSALGAL